MQPLTNGMPGALVELLRGSPNSDGKVTFAWKAAVGPAIARVSSRNDWRSIDSRDSGSSKSAIGVVRAVRGLNDGGDNLANAALQFAIVRDG